METVSQDRAGELTAERGLEELTAPASFSIRHQPPASPGRRGRQLPTRLTKVVLGLLDLVTVVLALFAALDLSRRTGNAPEVVEVELTRRVLLESIPLWAFVFVRARLYNTRFVADRRLESKRIATAAFFGTLGLALISDLFHRNDPAGQIGLQRDFLIYAGLLVFAGVVAERELVRQWFIWQRRHGRRLRAVAVIGDNSEGIALMHMFQNDPALGYDFRGFIRVDRAGDRSQESRRHLVLGHVDDTLEILRSHEIDAVMIAASATDVAMTNSLVRELLKADVRVELSPSLPDIAAERLSVRPLGRFPVMYLEPFDQAGWASTAKRVFDFVASLLALIVLALPLMALALVIRIDSPGGSVFFRQVRVGRNGQLFEVLKFRTMVPNAEQLRAQLAEMNEADGPLFKIKNDPRITRCGRFLRKTSLDELPQLWNVLAGEMSLVGPRPALPEEAELWSPELRDRLRVQPGITGMWQVSGRSNTSFEEYSRLDLYYVDNWSLVTDLAIIAKTFPSVVLQRGAS